MQRSSQELSASWNRCAQSSSDRTGIKRGDICLQPPRQARQEFPTEVCISQRKKLIITMDFSKPITILSMFENASVFGQFLYE